MSESGNLKSFVEYCARNLVDHPDLVHVDERVTGQAAVYTLRVGPTDLGKVIGREGKTAHALRTLLSAAAQALDRRAVLEIAD
ncbi:MAG: KH domain-containing protein [Candidatus Eisenbacteria bacterium]|uniref:RNA-binding protein KhpA n=1 Tax=Eiseniibacteriota bacterium TaxID=2212470 RepID=A0A538S879_UNCEI|nr:MAG: KH domain-containing protein [Candidatus Eisenbacteria bacterium]